MPNTKSAIRRVRRVKKQTQVNRIRKSKYKTAVKKMELYIKTKENEKAKTLNVRYRTCGDMPITGAVESKADTLDKVINEIAATRTTERGTRADDKRGETAMEDRKKQGYF